MLCTASLLLLLAGCSDDTVEDKTCVPACGSGYTCFHGICIKQDGGVADQGSDAKKPDMTKADLKQPDLPTPDMKQADMMQPDMMQADMMQADMMQADMMQADMMQADMMQADVSKKDVFMADWAGPKPDQANTTCAMVMGKACTKSGFQCGSGATCLLTSSSGNEGVCTCSCSPDNTATPLVNEDTCPGAYNQSAVCGKITLTGGTSANYCFKTCKPKLGSNDCSGSLYCHPRSGAAIGKFSLAVCLYHGGCTKNADCPVNNGKTCDTQNVTKKCTGTGETCQALVTGGTAGLCAVAGVCDTTSRLCDKHTLGKNTAKVGDPCKSDLDCAGTQSCFIEFDEATHLKSQGKSCGSDSECCSDTCQFGFCAAGAPCRVRNRNGYCSTSSCVFANTLTIAKCDSTSVCNALYSGGICQKSCDLKIAKDCRGYKKATGTVVDYLGDYECRAWNNLSIGGTPISSKSVCDFGYTMPCDMLSGSTLNCSSVGLMSNPTKMECRGTDNLTKTSPWDPTGLCLDDTSSGNVAP